jgi:BMFP domain-containing protein YqiC
MNTPKPDEFINRIIDALPGGLDDLRQDTEKNLKSALAKVLEKMDLVSREEFEVQQAVLLRTREKLDAMEQQLKDLEKASLEKQK